MSVTPDGPFPTPRQALLLRAALGDCAVGRTAWAEFRAGGGRLEDLDGASLRLLPQLYRNLEACGVRDESTAKLSGVYRHAWYANHTLWRAAATAVAALHAAAVPVMVLKGAAITALYPGGIGTRPMNDVDLLVRPADVAHAASLLRALGFQDHGHPPFAAARRVQHSAPFRRRDGAEIDLHWHLLVQLGDDSDIWERARSSTLVGTEVLVPSPADQLLHTCVHGLSLCPAPMRWIADAVLITRARDEVDWELVVREASRRDVAVVMTEALRFLRDEFGASIPASVIDALGNAPATPTSRLLHRVASGRTSLRHGTAYLEYWDRYRRRERMQARRPSPLGYASFVADSWGLDDRRALARALLRKAVEIARFGTSAPGGTRFAGGRPQRRRARGGTSHRTLRSR